MASILRVPLALKVPIDIKEILQFTLVAANNLNRGIKLELTVGTVG